MPKRVSVKGRGAGIFFGEAAPPVPTPAALPPVLEVSDPFPASAVSRTAPTLDGGYPEGQDPATTKTTPARHESNEPSKLVKREASKQVSKQATLEERLQAVLGAEDLKANTFRYTHEELAGIRDAVYELETQYGKKIDKNDVVRIALNWLLYDFQAKKEESLLVSILTSK